LEGAAATTALELTTSIPGVLGAHATLLHVQLIAGDSMRIGGDGSVVAFCGLEFEEGRVLEDVLVSRSPRSLYSL
jgi:hypothetical protein